MQSRSPDVVGIGVRYRLRQAPDVIWPTVILSLFRFDSTHDVAELETIGFGHMCYLCGVVGWRCM